MKSKPASGNWRRSGCRLTANSQHDPAGLPAGQRNHRRCDIDADSAFEPLANRSREPAHATPEIERASRRERRAVLGEGPEQLRQPVGLAPVLLRGIGEHPEHRIATAELFPFLASVRKRLSSMRVDGGTQAAGMIAGAAYVAAPGPLLNQDIDGSS